MVQWKRRRKKSQAEKDICEFVQQRLVQLKDEAGLSNQDLADILGVSEQAASQRMKSAGNVTLGTLVRLADAVGAKVEVKIVPYVSAQAGRGLSGARVEDPQGC